MGKSHVDIWAGVVFNSGMRSCVTMLFLACLPVACTQVQTTRITNLTDLPLKSTTVPDWDWEKAPLRANARYAMYKAHTVNQRKDRLGDYYYLDWYDAEPQQPVKIVMSYTQALTGAAVLTRTIEFNKPRTKAGSRQTQFFFSGPERAKGGDIMSWRIDLYCGGKLVDHRQSYLWE